MKKKRVLISPSLLSSDFARLKEEVQAIEKAGADLLHLDIMDGHFVPNLTFGPYGVACIKKYATKPLDVHLMLANPAEFIRAFADAGADMLSIHIEACGHIQRSLEEIKKLGIRAGIALNPATPVCTLQYVAGYADFIMMMTVNPGFGGQTFLPPVLDKIRHVRELLDTINPACQIEVDGGIDFENAPLAVSAGADILVSGNTIFKYKSYKQAIEKLRG